MSDSKDMSDLDSSVVKKLNVPELRSELVKRGLDAKGLKQTLVDRLLASLQNNEEPVEIVTEEKASDSKLHEAVDHANQTDTNSTISSSLSGETRDTENAFNGVQTAEADNYQVSTDQTAHSLPVESTNSDTNNCEECTEVLCSETSNDMSTSSITDCKCFCGVLAAELEGIKLDIVILQKCSASNSCSTLESSNTNEEIQRLNRELSHEKRKNKQLENDLSLVVRERNKEIEELNKTIYSLREKSIKSEQEKDSIMLAFNLVMQDKMQILNNNCHDKFHEQVPGDDHETTDTETKEDQYTQYPNLEVEQRGTTWKVAGSPNRNRQRVSNPRKFNKIKTNNKFDALADDVAEESCTTREESCTIEERSSNETTTMNSTSVQLSDKPPSDIGTKIRRKSADRSPCLIEQEQNERVNGIN